MAAFIMNPRRAPRAPARCRTAVVSPAGTFDTETEDIGSRGCQIVSPRLLKKGDRLQLVVSNDGVPEPLRVAGTVAWVSPQPPWRVGIAFEEAGCRDGARWFERLLAAFPAMGAHGRVPERISVEATVYLGPPPRFLVDFSADEALLLRAIASGARIDELQARLRAQWPAAQRALFSLLTRQAVTLARGHAVHPDTWKKILADVEASLAVESLGQAPAAFSAPMQPAPPAPTPAPAPRLAPTPAPVPTPASPWGTPPLDPHPAIELPDEGPALDLAGPAHGAGPGAGPGEGARHAPPDFAGAGVGWRARAPRVRSQEAQAIFDRARAEIAGGSVHGAIALLRKALSLAPGDPEIAGELGKLAFKDRKLEEK